MYRYNRVSEIRKAVGNEWVEEGKKKRERRRLIIKNKD